MTKRETYNQARGRGQRMLDRQPHCRQEEQRSGSLRCARRGQGGPARAPPPQHSLCCCCCRARRSGWLPPTFISASRVVPVWQKGGRGGNVTRSRPRPPPACAQHFAAASFGSHKPPRSRLQPCSSERMWQRRHYARRGSDNDK